MKERIRLDPRIPSTRLVKCEEACPRDLAILDPRWGGYKASLPLQEWGSPVLKIQFIATVKNLWTQKFR